MRRNESDEFGNSEQAVSRFSAFGWRSGFSLSSAKLLVKVSIDILSAFRLLPRLEEVYIHRVHSKPQPPRFAEKWFTNSHVLEFAISHLSAPHHSSNAFHVTNVGRCYHRTLLPSPPPSTWGTRVMSL